MVFASCTVLFLITIFILCGKKNGMGGQNAHSNPACILEWLKQPTLMKTAVGYFILDFLENWLMSPFNFTLCWGVIRVTVSTHTRNSVASV